MVPERTRRAKAISLISDEVANLIFGHKLLRLSGSCEVAESADGTSRATAVGQVAPGAVVRPPAPAGC